MECEHSLAAQVRELRLIAAHKPPYNRRSRFPECSVWLKLTVEPYPRLTVVRRVGGRDHSGALAPAAALARHQRLLALARCALLLAAQPADDGGWEVVLVRHGRLVESGRVPRGAAPRPYLDALVTASEEVSCGPGATPCASAAEMECILRWLTMPGTRLVELVGQWCSPAYGAGGLAALAETKLAR